ncbi:hypothetical protein AXG53_17235 [Stenotrophomonas sp. KCTC 12332]|nr:hypothetical protein AXG53_17235 [Stenotrophomonas sp. KCTC 12332]
MPSGLPMLSAKNIKARKISFDEYRLISQDAFDHEDKRTSITPGDVLLTIVGAIGRTAIALDSHQKFTLQRSVAVLKPDAIASKYLSYLLESPEAQSFFEKNAKGTAQKGIYLKTLGGMKVPVAPVAEQARIAQALDGLLAQVDTLKARLDTLPALIKHFRESVLETATSGKLTENWRKNYGNREWKSIAVGELCRLKSGIAASIDLEHHEGSHKYFKVGEMNLKGNELYLHETGRYLSLDDFSEKALLPAGSIVFPKRGGAIATNKKRILKEESFVDLNVMGLIVPTGVEVLYVYRWLETIDLAKLNTGTAIPQINNSDIAPLIIPLPPSDEQYEIVRRVEQLFVFADQLEARLADARQRVDALTQSILAKAFRGELVPQDPNDEPASVLLERIAAQRAAEPKPKRGRKTAAH